MDSRCVCVWLYDLLAITFFFVLRLTNGLALLKTSQYVSNIYRHMNSGLLKQKFRFIRVLTPIHKKCWNDLCHSFIWIILLLYYNPIETLLLNEQRRMKRRKNREKERPKSQWMPKGRKEKRLKCNQRTITKSRRIWNTLCHVNVCLGNICILLCYSCVFFAFLEQIHHSNSDGSNDSSNTTITNRI